MTWFRLRYSTLPNWADETEGLCLVPEVTGGRWDKCKLLGIPPLAPVSDADC